MPSDGWVEVPASTRKCVWPCGRWFVARQGCLQGSWTKSCWPSLCVGVSRHAGVFATLDAISVMCTIVQMRGEALACEKGTLELLGSGPRIPPSPCWATGSFQLLPGGTDLVSMCPILRLCDPRGTGARDEANLG